MAITKTNEQNTKLVVCTLPNMYLSPWIQIKQWKSKFWQFWEKLKTFVLSSAHDTREERPLIWCISRFTPSLKLYGSAPGHCIDQASIWLQRWQVPRLLHDGGITKNSSFWCFVFFLLIFFNQDKHFRSLTFPAVTICNYNRFWESRIDEKYHR